MPLHHYLPASFIARFSSDMRKVPSRQKRVIVGDKKTQKCFQASAEKVGCINNLYTIANGLDSPEVVDQTWTAYEKNLPTALDSLINGIVEAETWMRVLVPFVACMLVRGPDFEERFTNRFPPYLIEKLKGLFDADHANVARLRELPLLLTGVLAAKWLVLRAHGKEKIITNDLGYAPFMHPPSGNIGLAIPLNFKTILAIIPAMENRSILYERNNQWVPDIKYLDLPSGNQEGLNRSLATVALRFVFGPDIPTVQKYVRGTTELQTAPEPGQLGFPKDVFSRAFEFTWYRLVGAIAKPPSDLEDWDFALNWEVITSGWYSKPFAPLNLVEFPPALERAGNSIKLNFYDPQFYFDISAMLFLEKDGNFDEAIKFATKALEYEYPAETKVVFLVRRARLHFKQGNIAEARADQDLAIALAPNEDAKNRILKDLQFSLGTRLKIFLKRLANKIAPAKKA